MHTDRKTKITVPGPFTMLLQAQNDFYASEEEAAMDFAGRSTRRSVTYSPPART